MDFANEINAGEPGREGSAGKMCANVSHAALVLTAPSRERS